MPDHTEQTAPERPKVLFSEFFSKHRNGLADADVTDALRELIDACARHRKPGSLTLTIKVAAQGDMLAILDSCKTSTPEEPAEPKLYWVDMQGNLTRNNPMQPALPFAERTDAHQ